MSSRRIRISRPETSSRFRDEASAKATAERIEASGGEAIALRTDVSNEPQVEQAIAATVERFGRLDAAMNNAGITRASFRFHEMTLEEWNRMLAVNLTGVFLCTRAAFQLMKRQNPRGGRIINNGSISAHVPRPFSVPYTAAKHGVTGLTRATSLDGREFDIACGQIDIGNASTEMTARMSGGVPQADGSLASEPTMDADNVARAIVYMATLPLDANVPFMTVMANGMPYIGRG